MWNGFTKLSETNTCNSLETTLQAISEPRIMPKAGQTETHLTETAALTITKKQYRISLKEFLTHCFISFSHLLIILFALLFEKKLSKNFTR